jgi:hypothetical protein
LQHIIASSPPASRKPRSHSIIASPSRRDRSEALPNKNQSEDKDGDDGGDDGEGDEDDDVEQEEETEHTCPITGVSLRSNLLLGWPV